MEAKTPEVMHLSAKLDYGFMGWLFFYAIFMWFLGYGIRSESNGMHFHLLQIEKMYSAYHFWAAVACGSVCLLFLRQSDKLQECGKSRIAISISNIGKICVIVLMACTTMVGLIGLLGGEGLLAYLENFTKVMFAFTIMVIFCLVAIWPRNVVGDDMIDIVNGRIHYPGEAYRVYPFCKYELETISKSLCIPEMIFHLVVNNKGAKLEVSAGMKVLIDEIVSSGIRHLNCRELFLALESSVRSEIEVMLKAGQEKDGHPGNFFKLANDLPREPRSYSFQGISVIWQEIVNFKIMG
jgi:hypothetical protein